MKLAELLQDHRFTRRLTLRQLAAQIGVSAATISRLEAGRGCDGTTMARLLTWLLAPTSASAEAPAQDSLPLEEQ